MYINLIVVRRNNELLFKHAAPKTDSSNGGHRVLFNRLSALPEFMGGEVAIHRRGEIIDFTHDISRYITSNASGIAFKGLRRLFEQSKNFSHRGEATYHLDANDFNELDIIKIKFDDRSHKKCGFLGKICNLYRVKRYVGETAAAPAPLDAPLPPVLKF